MDPEVLAQLTESIQKYNEMLSQQGAAMSGAIKSMTDLRSSMKAGTKANADGTAAKIRATGATNRLADAEQRAEDIRAEAAENYKASVNNSTAAAKSFGSALISGEAGLEKYGQSVELMSTAAIFLSKGLGIYNTALSLFLTGFGLLTTQIFKLDTSIIEFRDGFTKVAGILPMTTDELGHLSSQAGFSGADMKKLAKATTALGGQLMGLSGNAGTGAEKFLKMADVGDDVRKRFGRLGVSQEDLLDMQAKYVQLQSASGNAYRNSLKNEQQLKEESIAYADNLLKVQTLTGKKADQLQSEREKAANRIEEQAYKAAEISKIKDLKSQAAAKGLETAEGKQLLKEAQTKQDALDKNDAIRQKFTDKYDADVGTAMAMYARGIRTRETVQAAQLAGPAFEKLTKTSAEGIVGVGKNEEKKAIDRQTKYRERLDAVGDEATDEYKDNADKRTVWFQSTIGATGDKFLKALGLSQNIISTNNQQAAKTGKEARADYEAEKKKKEAKGNDKVADNVEDLRATERNVKKGFQLMLEGLDPLRGGLHAFLFGLVGVTGLFLTLGGGKGVGGIVSKIPGAQMAKTLGSKIPGAGMLGKLFSGGAGAAGAGATGAATGAAGKAAGGAGSAAMAGLNKAVGAIGPLIGGIIKGLAEGLAVAGGLAPEIAIGGVAIGAAITAIAIGIGASAAIIGVTMPLLAKGLSAFDKVNGPNLAMAGLGMIALGVGIAAVGAGSVIGALGSLARLIPGNEDPIEKISKQVEDLGKYQFNAAKVKTNSEAIVDFTKAMVKSSQASDAVSKSGIDKIFGKGGPIEAFGKFAKMDFGPNMEKNAEAFSKYAQAAQSTQIAKQATAPAASPVAPSGDSGGDGGGGGLGSAISSGLKKAGAAISNIAGGAADLGQRAFNEATAKPDESVISGQGKSVKVAKEAAPKFQATLDYMTQHGYKIRSLGGYVNRDVRGHPGIKSAHSRGWAIDVNPKENPLQEGSGPVKTDIPGDVVQFAKSQGLGWGGAWNSRRDAMHFSAQKNEGGQFSPQKASMGGIFDDTNTSFASSPAGKKLAPLQINSLLSKLAKIPAENMNQAAYTNHNMTDTTGIPDQAAMNVELYNMIQSKLSHVLSALEHSHSTQTKMLKHTLV